MKFYVASLGCARNFVDSDGMTTRLLAAGHTQTEDPAEAAAIVVNTCSFIEPAIDESIDTILALAKYKSEGACRRLIVTGCLPERFRQEIVNSLPEVDLFLGTGAFDQIAEALTTRELRLKCVLPDPDVLAGGDDVLPRSGHLPPMAYVKVAEGCDRSCTYCIIPKLRGRQKSRPIQNIVQEAASLIRSGVKELVLVAQETSAYGTDIGLRNGASRLLERLAAISSDVWIRLLYGHPDSMDETLIRTVSAAGNICPYFDIPIQHTSGRVLRRMGRHYRKDDLFRLFDRIREIEAAACLRTSVIVGFPGETEADFQELLQSVEEIRFDHLGAFIYSDMEDLASHGLKPRVPASVATLRHDTIMSRQQEISRQHNLKYLHQALQVLIEEEEEDGLYVGRTVFQAPEVDGVTYVRKERLTVGDFATVRINDTLAYDLTGEAL